MKGALMSGRFRRYSALVLIFFFWAGLGISPSSIEAAPLPVGTHGHKGNSHFSPEFPPCEPSSELANDLLEEEIPGAGESLPKLAFCSKWNPEFVFNGSHCCGKGARGSRRKRRVRCSIERARGTYCGEITPEQEDYTRLAQTGALGDVLKLIEHDLGQNGEQSYCTVNNGFLAWGRRLIPSEENRILLRAPDRCTEFGTDSMIGMLEWLGREIGKQFPVPDYPRTHLVIGDISAPRGGCLSGTGGRRGHLSHTTGQDVDISFLVAKRQFASPTNFHRDFDAKGNWEFLKTLFKNPYACVKVIFLDRRLIGKLAKAARRDEEWGLYGRFLRHMPGHRNHFHVRIGDGAGQPGCGPGADPDLEPDEEGEEGEAHLSDSSFGDSARNTASELLGIEN